MGKSLEDQFSFYLSYHNNRVNQLIHIICVWPILISGQVMMAYSKSVSNYLPQQLQAFIPQSISIPVNNSTLTFETNILLFVSLYYATFYASTEQPIGLLAALFVISGYLFSQYAIVAYENAFQVALIIHVICWIAQFYGHGVHEKRSPALIDNPRQALIFAPLFVLIEIAAPFGYKADFMKKMQKIAEANIREFKKGKKN